jgi:putative transposase
MPSRYTVKEDLPQGIYHAFNRGVERRRIFVDHHDYQRFKQQMRQALDREPSVTLLAYSLMPNHIHILLRQSEAEAMGRWFQRLITGYVVYFNKRHERIGPLFQGKYKATRVVGPGHLMEESRYIHVNPERAGLGWRQHQHSSLQAYLEPETADGFVDTWPVLQLFDMPNDYMAYLSKAKVRP